MMRNKEVIQEVRTAFFHMLKEYTRIEDKHNIINPYNVNSKTLKYLADVNTLFEDFKGTVNDIYIMVMKSLGEEK